MRHMNAVHSGLASALTYDVKYYCMVIVMMKKRWGSGLFKAGRMFLLMGVLAAVLCSCSSLSLEMKAQAEGVPLWMYAFDVPAGRVSFIGTGNDSDARRAALRAYTDISGQISDYLGASLSDDQYRELTTSGYIGDFSLSTQSRYERTESDGTVTMHILTIASETRLNAGRTAAAAELERLEIEAEKKLQSAQALYQSDRDVDAVKLYLEVAAMAVRHDLKNVSVDDIIARAVSLIDRIQITLVNPDPALARTMVKVQRRYSIFPSDIEGATVKAYVRAKRLDDIEYGAEYVFATSANGTFSFISPNSGLVRTGSIVFSIDLGEALDGYLAVMSQENCDLINNALSRKHVVFDYELVSPYSSARIALCVIELDEYGDVVSPLDEPSLSATLLAKLLSHDGIEVHLFASDESEDHEEFLNDLLSQQGDYEYMIKGVVGVADSSSSNHGVSVLANGFASLHKRDDANPLYESGSNQTAAFADNMENARREALEQYVKVVYSQLRDCFFFL